ncbi:hypothetical protein C8R46DRAFT_1042325 [Mycena filopes]|nr:hypothetical protein C8R46DRAFT_1042325 [Mycena filopes]
MNFGINHRDNHPEFHDGLTAQWVPYIGEQSYESLASLWHEKFQFKLHRRAFILLNLAEVEVSMGVAHSEIQQQLDSVQTMANDTGETWLRTASEAIQADLTLREGNNMLAFSLFCNCLKSAWGNDSEMKQKLGIHKALQFIADIFLKNGDIVTATSLFTLALDGFTQMDMKQVANVEQRVAEMELDDQMKLLKLGQLTGPAGHAKETEPDLPEPEDMVFEVKEMMVPD